MSCEKLTLTHFELIKTYIELSKTYIDLSKPQQNQWFAENIKVAKK